MKGLPVTEQNSEGEDLPVSEPTHLEKFAQTSSAAKLSGKVHQTMGFFKRKVGEMTDDSLLKETGENQELLGKVHSMVGTIRELRERAVAKGINVSADGAKILRKHAGKILDQANEFIEDIRDTFFKN